MAKKPTPAPQSKAAAINEEVLAGDVQAANQLAVLELAAQENVVALAHQLGYDGALTVGALEDGIRFYQQRTAEACMELGKRLILLKEASLHGEFKPRLELLGIEYTAATRFMAVASKFSKVATSQLLKMAASQGKVIELLVLDDEEIAELADGGTVRGMSVDTVASMGVRELRAALREHMAEKDATDKLLADKNAKIDRLSRHIKKATPDTVLLELKKESTAIMADARGCITGQLRQAIIQVRNHGDEDHSVFLAGLVGQLQADLHALREEFNLPDVSNAADLQLAAEVAQWGGPVTKGDKAKQQ